MCWHHYITFCLTKWFTAVSSAILCPRAALPGFTKKRGSSALYFAGTPMFPSPALLPVAIFIMVMLKMRKTEGQKKKPTKKLLCHEWGFNLCIPDTGTILLTITTPHWIVWNTISGSLYYFKIIYFNSSLGLLFLKRAWKLDAFLLRKLCSIFM